MIPYGRQEITEADIAAVQDVLRSDFITQGQAVPDFEFALAKTCKAKFAVATSSATAALHLSCLALGVKTDDWVWTSPNTFAASANCALYCGAQIDFVDIDERTYNLCALKLEEKLIAAEKNNCLPKVLIVVHFSGQPCDLKAVRALSLKYGFKVVEDASHAVGAQYDGEPIGACIYSDITVFSFHPVKIITTGEGGAVLTNDASVARRIELLRSHGITRDSAELEANAPQPWHYEQQHLGYNYRMTDIQAALGISQLGRLPGYISKRHEIAQRYELALAGQDLLTPWQHPTGHSSYHLFVIRIPGPATGDRRNRIGRALRSAGIQVNLHYIPVHLHPFYKQLGFKLGAFPAAEQYYSQALSLPMYPTLTTREQDSVVEHLTNEMNR